MWMRAYNIRMFLSGFKSLFYLNNLVRRFATAVTYLIKTKATVVLTNCLACVIYDYTYNRSKILACPNLVSVRTAGNVIGPGHSEGDIDALLNKHQLTILGASHEFPVSISIVLWLD